MDPWPATIGALQRPGEGSWEDQEPRTKDEDRDGEEHHAETCGQANRHHGELEYRTGLATPVVHSGGVTVGSAASLSQQPASPFVIPRTNATGDRRHSLHAPNVHPFITYDEEVDAGVPWSLVFSPRRDPDYKIGGEAIR
jgi:hypothetical protein